MQQIGMTVKITIAKEEGLAEGLEKGLEKGKEEGIAEGLKKGKHNAKIETAKKMLQDGLILDIVSKYTGLTIEVINALDD